MLNGFAKVKQLLDSSIGPPAEGMKLVRELTNPETSRRIDKLLLRVERLSKDASSLPQVIELLKLIEQMNDSGSLDKLVELLGLIPKGQTGKTLVLELRKIIAELSPRLDQLASLAKVLMEKED